jgi:hypothetical protein
MSKYELSNSIANDSSSKSNTVWDCKEILQFYIAIMFAEEFITALHYVFVHFHSFHTF